MEKVKELLRTLDELKELLEGLAKNTSEAMKAETKPICDVLAIQGGIKKALLYFLSPFF